MFGLVCFPSLALWSSSTGRKETLWWFCFACEEVHRGKKGSFKPKQSERDSPLLAWFGLLWFDVGFSFCLFSTIVRQMMIFEFALDKCLMLTSTNRWFCLGALFYA